MIICNSLYPNSFMKPMHNALISCGVNRKETDLSVVRLAQLLACSLILSFDCYCMKTGDEFEWVADNFHDDMNFAAEKVFNLCERF